MTNETKTMENLIQILTDPENQPHQYVGCPADLRAALAAPRELPPSDGLELVPAVPTEAMYEAGMKYLNRRGTAWSINDLYRVMVAAS